MQNRRLRQDTDFRSCRHIKRGVLCTARTGRDGRRQEQKVQNRRLRQDTVFRSCRYENGGVLCTARTRRDGRHQEQKVQNRRLGKQPSFGVAGRLSGEYCAQHALEGMVDFKSRKCRTASCGKRPCFGVAGTKTGEYCAQHAQEGMVNVMSRKCRIKGCGKRPCFGAAGTKEAEYCAQHTGLQRGVGGFRDGEVGPHHSGKKNIANVLPSVAKRTNVRPPPTKTSQPSGANRDSRKRVRHPETTSTASKRDVAREPTVPDNDGQRSPVKRDFSAVKMKVQHSL